MPPIIMDEGRLLRDRMQKSRVDDQDILEAARQAHGVENLHQTKYAMLERS